MTLSPTPPQAEEGTADRYLAALRRNHGATLARYASDSADLSALGVQYIASAVDGMLHSIGQAMGVSAFETPLIVTAISTTALPQDFYSAAALAAFVNHAALFDVELEWLADAHARGLTSVDETVPAAIEHFFYHCGNVAEIMAATCRTAVGARRLWGHRDALAFLAEFRAEHVVPAFLLDHDRAAMRYLLGGPPNLAQDDEALLASLGRELGVNSDTEAVILDRALQDVTIKVEMFCHGAAIAILEQALKRGTDVSGIVTAMRRNRGRFVAEKAMPADVLSFLEQVWDLCPFIRDTRRVGSAIAGLHKYRHASRSFH